MTVLAGMMASGTAAAGTAAAGTAAATAAGTVTAATGATLSSTLFGTGVTAAGMMGPFIPTAGMIGTGGSISLASLANGFSFLSAGMSLFGGASNAQFAGMSAQQNAQALEFSARENELNARQEEIAGKRSANDMMDNLVQTIADQRTAYAANGIDISFGTPLNVAENTRALANLQMSTTRQDAATRAFARRRQAMALRSERDATLMAGKQAAGNAMMDGLTKAGGSLAEIGMRRLSRG